MFLFHFFPCRTRGFCPTCQAKRLEQWGEWVGKWDLEWTDYLAFFAPASSPVPAKGQVTVRYSGLFENPSRMSAPNNSKHPSFIRQNG
jgi:hypothetical protein